MLPCFPMCKKSNDRLSSSNSFIFLGTDSRQRCYITKTVSRNSKITKSSAKNSNKRLYSKFLYEFLHLWRSSKLVPLQKKFKRPKCNFEALLSLFVGVFQKICETVGGQFLDSPKVGMLSKFSDGVTCFHFVTSGFDGSDNLKRNEKSGWSKVLKSTENHFQ